MTPRINLLPYREQRRTRQRRQFAALMAGAVVVGVAIWVAGHALLSGYVENQTARNEYLKREIAKVDKEIEAVRRLREDIQALLGRKKIIESLQTDRGQSVLLLDQLAAQTPDGLYLRSLKQDGAKITLGGYAQTNARVSTFMRNLETAGVFEQPVLVEVKAVTVNNRRLADFSLTTSLKPVRNEVPGGAPAPAAPPPAAAKG